MISRFLLVPLLISTTFASSEDRHKWKLGGDCEALRVELEGAGDSSTKLAKLNAFLDKLGEDTREKFWSIVSAAKNDAQTNLPTDTSKSLAGEVISDFEEGNLFLSHKQVSEELKSKFNQLNEEEKTAVKNLAKEYGKQIKALVMPLLPENCKASTDAVKEAAAATQAGGFDTADYMPRRKRELLFIENLTAAFRELRARRSL